MALTLGRVTINVAAMITHLVAQGAPLLGAHALAAVLVSFSALVAFALLRAPFDLLATLLLALGATLLKMPAATAGPHGARLRPSRLAGRQEAQNNEGGDAFHDVCLTAASTGS